ncbi:NAD(P)/FAD-dependent oxidoreductase, partial [Acinetobacter baumannii]
MPKRFAEKFCDMRGGDAKLSSFGEKDIAQLADLLANWKLKPKGTVGYKKAEVTRGGVDTDCLSSKTMEAKTVKGLYFIGEVVDVT